MSPASDLKIVFSRAKMSDAGKLLDWIERYYRYDHIEFQRQKIEYSLHEILTDDRFGSAYFIDQDEATIGYFILTDAFDLEFGGRHAILTDFFLDEKQRGSGTGTLALRFMESLCLGKNFNHLELQVEIDNEEAKSFYSKSNFKILTRHILIKKLGNQST